MFGAGVTPLIRFRHGLAFFERLRRTSLRQNRCGLLEAVLGPINRTDYIRLGHIGAQLRCWDLVWRDDGGKLVTSSNYLFWNLPPHQTKTSKNQGFRIGKKGETVCFCMSNNKHAAPA